MKDSQMQMRKKTIPEKENTFSHDLGMFARCSKTQHIPSIVPVNVLYPHNMKSLIH